MSHLQKYFSASLIVLAFGLASANVRADETSKPTSDCFRGSQWRGWKAASQNVIYLRVGVRNIYRLDLLPEGPSLLLYPDARLINIDHGPDMVCLPVDFDLSVADRFGGFKEHLFIKAITKLTPEEADAIPKEFRP